MIFLQFFIFLLGLAALILSFRAIWKGPNYITACNAAFSDRTLKNIFHEDMLGYFIFRLTPLSILAMCILAGISSIYAILLPLESTGFIDKDGEWMSLRYTFSSIIGFALGYFFCDWLLKLCRQVPYSKEITESDLTNEQELRLLIGKK